MIPATITLTFSSMKEHKREAYSEDEKERLVQSLHHIANEMKKMIFEYILNELNGLGVEIDD